MIMGMINLLSIGAGGRNQLLHAETIFSDIIVFKLTDGTWLGGSLESIFLPRGPADESTYNDVEIYSPRKKAERLTK